MHGAGRRFRGLRPVRLNGPTGGGERAGRASGAIFRQARPVHGVERGATEDVSSVMEAHRGRFAQLLRPDLEDLPTLRAEK